MSKFELQSFKIEKKEFLKGSNAYDNYPSGGYLNSTIGVNVFSKPGLITNPPAIPSAVTTTNPGTGFVGFANGFNGSGAGTCLGMYVNSATNDAYFTLIVPTTGAHGTPQSDTTRDYNLYQSDVVWYKNKFLASGVVTVADINAANSAIDGTWLTSQTDTRTGVGATILVSNVPHPMLVFEDILYIADGRYLHKLDGTNYTTQVFDLPEGYNITALVEFRGMIYMFASPTTFADGTSGDLPSHGKSKLYSWDGLQDTWFEEYDIDYPVYSAFVWKNTLYAFNKYNLSYWNGSELSPIWPVTNKIYKHQVTFTSDSFFFADGTRIIRYGRPHGITGPRKFYIYLDAPTTDVPFAGIVSFYNESLLLSERNALSKTYYISSINTPTTSETSKTFDFNPRMFKKPVKIRQIVIETEALTSGQKVKPGFVNDEGEAVYPTSDSGEFAYATASMAGKRRWVFDIFKTKATREIIPRLILTKNVHVKSVEYFFEGSEIKGNE